jgi:regulator of telomere elongation helicase 1
MVLRGQAFVHSIDGKSFYFPYKKLNEPQKNYIKAMFDCLDNKQNLLIESPTGTGKTLSLLVGALSWAERHYMNSLGGKWENRIKIIYTSRAHSQLSQISKELEKTPYRPKMLLFGSR